MDTSALEWPLEFAREPGESEFLWHDGGANRVLDFHGDPAKAGVVLFSDGNHHMALAPSLQAFVAQHGNVDDVFYLTLPPPLLMKIIQAGGIRIANLKLSLAPTLFIGPEGYISNIAKSFDVTEAKPFARSRGQALLIRRGNPKSIRSVADVFRDDIRLFISHPQRETASFEVYAQTLALCARQHGVDGDAFTQRLRQGERGVVHGANIHHREAPAAVARGEADVAILYYHLALRYTRIFSEHFELLPIAGAGTAQHDPAFPTTEYFVAAKRGHEHAQMLAGWFSDSQAVKQFYGEHGLEAAQRPGLVL